MMNALELATLALDVLDAQKRYFSDRTKTSLIVSKQLEAKLKAEAQEIINEQGGFVF